VGCGDIDTRNTAAFAHGEGKLGSGAYAVEEVNTDAVCGKHLGGNLGEKLARRQLKKEGYKILKRNYVAEGAEIDIIAKDKDCYVFIEVKTRTSVRFGEPMESVTPFKQRHIIRSAQSYLMLKKIDENQVEIRFDVIEVKSDNGKNEINHVKNAFITQA
jgi:putative endonuclease